MGMGTGPSCAFQPSKETQGGDRELQPARTLGHSPDELGHTNTRVLSAPKNPRKEFQTQSRRAHALVPVGARLRIQNSPSGMPSLKNCQCHDRNVL